MQRGELAALRRKWDARLAAEGLAVIQPLATEFHGAITLKGRQLHVRHEIQAPMFEVAADYLWRTNWGSYPQRERAIWELFALEGATCGEIAAELGEPRSSVIWVVRQHRDRAGIGRRVNV